MTINTCVIMKDGYGAGRLRCRTVTVLDGYGAGRLRCWTVTVSYGAS